MKANKLIVAAAGAGKTTFIVNEALKHIGERALITTYTQANEIEIRRKIFEINKCIPSNITVQTWFSFLLQHCVRPYQGTLFEKNIKGLILVNSQSGLKFKRNGIPVYYSEAELERHYFSKDIKIYSDKISKFGYKCNAHTNGAVIDRLSRVYPNIFIDEVQDLAGYDLELLKLIFKARMKALLVGDPRQGTYSTNSSAKNKKFRKSGIVHFFQDKTLDIETDTVSLVTNHRCIAPICDLSNKLFPDFCPTTSGNNELTGHDGVFLIRKEDVGEYLKLFSPMQLRDNIKTTIDENSSVMNFGESKGLSFERVLIYPTEPFTKWLLNNDSQLQPTSRSKFYVAITRARNSVGIVYNYTDQTKDIDGISKWRSPVPKHDNQ